MLDVGIKETTTTTGTGTVTLSAVANHARVSQAFGLGEPVSYCLTSSNGDREWGIGIAGASNTLERTVISATLVGTTYTKNGSAISLSGTSDLIVTQNGAAAQAGALHIKTPGGHVAVFCPFAASNYGDVATTLFANQMAYVPFQMQGSMFPFTTMGVQVKTPQPGSTVDLAIYESKFVGDIVLPGLRVALANLDSSTAGNKFATINFTPRPGAVYWFAVGGASNPAIRAITNTNQVGTLGIGIGNTNSTMWVVSTGGTAPADASGESFSPRSSGNPPHLMMGY